MSVICYSWACLAVFFKLGHCKYLIMWYNATMPMLSPFQWLPVKHGLAGSLFLLLLVLEDSLAVFLVTQLTESRHWKITKHKPKPVVQPHPFFIHHQTSEGRATTSLTPAVKRQYSAQHNSNGLCQKVPRVTYSGIVVDVLLEIFIFAKNWFGDKMIILDTGNWNQRSWIHFCQPCNLLCFLVILQRRHKPINSITTNGLKTDLF